MTKSIWLRRGNGCVLIYCQLAANEQRWLPLPLAEDCPREVAEAFVRNRWPQTGAIAWQ